MTSNPWFVVSASLRLWRCRRRLELAAFHVRVLTTYVYHRAMLEKTRAELMVSTKQ